MKKHIRIYTDYFQIGEQDRHQCEMPGCNSIAVDVHHIENRGMGGSKLKDHITNLMGLCRNHHNQCEHGQITRDNQKRIHIRFMHRNKPTDAIGKKIPG